MRKAWLIAAREIRWEIYGDRGSVLRALFFVAFPALLGVVPRDPTSNEGAVFLLAVQTALVPAVIGVTLIASTFSAELENQTLLPLLAAPVRDIDIVVGKLLGMLVPVTALSAVSLATFAAVASAFRGAALVQRALPPQTLFALLVVGFLYVLTVGSWVMIVAARARSSRGAQQFAGIVVAFSFIPLTALAFVAVRLFNGWGLVGLGVLLVLADAATLELARRAWRRDEVIARV